MNCAAFIPIVIATANHYGIEPDIAIKVMQAESSCRVKADSGKGDIGLFQIRRGVTTSGFNNKSRAGLMRPRLNIRLGVRRLARAKRVCGGDPERWLSNYAGLRCGPSEYSRKVLYGRDRYRDLPLSSTSSENSGYNVFQYEKTSHK